MKPSGDKGFALYFLIAAILVVGALIGAGLSLVGPRAKKAKYDQTKDILAAAEQSVISWAIANGKLPDAATFPSVVSRSTDDWGNPPNPLVYIYDNNLIDITTGGVCGRSSTVLSYGTSTNTAFLIISGAEDMTVNTTPAVSGAFAGTVASGTADIVQAVSLENLKSQAGCSSFTAGRLRILNNELPQAVSGVPYSATIYVEGGVPDPNPVNPPYTVLPPSLPPNLTFTAWNFTAGGATISGTPTPPPPPPPVTVTIQVNDSGGNTTSRIYTLKIS